MWQARFVIYGLGRTGSNLLIHLLRSHPEIHCDGEIFNRATWPGAWRPAAPIVRRAPYAYLTVRSALQRRHSSRSVYGCKLPFATRAASLTRLHQAGWKVISLHRMSVFDQSISWCVAYLTSRFQHRPGEDHGPIAIPVEIFDRELERRRSAPEILASRLVGIPHFGVTYEQDLEHADRWQDLSRRLCAFLGVAPRTLETSFARTWQKPYDEIVTNYHDLAARAASAGTAGAPHEAKYHH